MPRFYCDYCDVYLTHDSFSGRKQHMRGRRHQDNVRQYYMQFLKRGVLNNAQNILLPGMGSVPTTSQAAARATPGQPSSSSMSQPVVANSSLIGHTMPTVPPSSVLSESKGRRSPDPHDGHNAHAPNMIPRAVSHNMHEYGASRSSTSGSASMSRYNPTM
mmetsp:Transcript_61119/g.97241  ORF Transcript_61119/g.97241 Transcript_61119/m.97241 type:complete len:160 (-) Transcript_61119:155-634(-)|eukprot:CAMPEP_0197033730 /NCGR_PEP_ID=MMETSP1384-20130603/12060_1 /TAXON_ID=29189 /ORGANISM="Ammonia sp." /LENGTH=159 /DNA_ID=CAMNT_0042463575 /DNA_START=22 /DNA_END=501 /DNA_ORIENTATION=+